MVYEHVRFVLMLIVRLIIHGIKTQTFPGWDFFIDELFFATPTRILWARALVDDILLDDFNYNKKLSRG